MFFLVDFALGLPDLIVDLTLLLLDLLRLGSADIRTVAMAMLVFANAFSN